MPEKILPGSPSFFFSAGADGDLLDHLASPGIAVLVGKGLEVVEVHMAEREPLFGPEMLFDLPLDRTVPGKPRQRARIAAAFLEELETLRHGRKGTGEAADLIVGG